MKNISYAQSGFFRRGAGFAIDLILLVLVWVTLVGKSFAVSANWTFGGNGLVSQVVNHNPVYAFYFLSALVIYFLALESIFGSTIGGLITGQRVVDGSKRKPAFIKIAVRSIFKFLDIVVGPIFFLFSNRNQSLGDHIAKVFVVRKKCLDLSIADGLATKVRRIFGGVFLAIWVAMMGMLLITLPKLGTMNENASFVLKRAQEKAISADVAGFYNLFVSKYKDQVSLESFGKSATDSKFFELVSALDVDGIKFSFWKFTDDVALIQGFDRNSFVEVAIQRDQSGDWGIVSLGIDNPQIENAK